MDDKARDMMLNIADTAPKRNGGPRIRCEMDHKNQLKLVKFGSSASTGNALASGDRGTKT